jgi:hypothetical protein
MQTTVEQHLANIRDTQGEEAMRLEIRRLAIAGIRTSPKHEAYWKKLVEGHEGIDWAELHQEAMSVMPEPTSTTAPEQMIADLLRKQMPGIKTQAQYDAVLGALDAVRIVANALLERDRFKEAEGRKVMELAFHAINKATELTLKLEDSPEAATSAAAEAFKAAPVEFRELEDQRRQLAELDSLTTVEEMNQWYAATKPRRDLIVTQNLRNQLMDAIRTKKAAL